MFDLLYRDINDLIQRYKTSFANNPNDPQARNTLHALLQLQTHLQSNNLPPHELEQVKAQVAHLAVNPPPSTSNAFVYSPPPVTSSYNAQSSLPQHLSPPPPMHYSPSPAAPAPPPPTQQAQPDLSSLLNSNNLANLLASIKAQQPAAPSPVPSAALPQPPTQYGQSASAPSPAVTEPPSSLIASLRAAGVLPPEGSTSANGVHTPVPAPVYPTVQAPNATVSLPTAANGSSTAGPRNDVELTSASLKM